MPAKPKIEDFDEVLVVEGYGDLLFYAEALEHVGRYAKVYIQELGGKSNFPTALETFINPGLLNDKTAIGFIVDANGAPQATKTKLETLLTRMTAQTVVNGRWTEGNPKIGLFIVPGDNQTGEIETLAWNSWANDPANDAQKKCILNYVACMNAAGKSAKSAHKGYISALLAIMSDEDPRLGPGARKKVFDLGRPELQELRNFLSGF